MTKIDISSLIRKAGQDVKQAKEKIIEVTTRGKGRRNATSSDVAISEGPRKLNIFNVMQYIEEPWGIGLRLYPMQRFIVKMYYNIPLDDKTRNIEITDMFRKRVLYRFTETELLSFLFREGRINVDTQDHHRRQLILAIGRRGGKCVVGNTRVITSKGIVRIEELNQGNETHQPLNVTVLQEGSKKSQTEYFYNGGEQKTFKITGYHGYHIEGTANHRIKVVDKDGKIRWRFLSKVLIGDKIAVVKGNSLWPKDYVDITSLGEGITDFTPPKQFDEVWAEFLGLFTSSGNWWQKKRVDIKAPSGLSFLSNIEELMQLTFGVFKTSYEDRDGRVMTHTRFDSEQACNYLRLLGAVQECGRYKTIPWVIFRSPRRVVLMYLRGLFEGQWGLREKDGVTLCADNLNFARDLQVLLLSLGMVSRIHPYNNVFFVNLVGSESINIFMNEIGFRDSTRWLSMRDNPPHIPLRDDVVVDDIPYQDYWLRRLRYSVPDHAWPEGVSRKQVGSRASLRKLLSTAYTCGDDSESTHHFQQFFDTDYYFDTVTEIATSSKPVYDLNVPDGEAFIANGLVNHNTTLSGIFASYEIYRLLNLYNPQNYYGLPPGNRIQIISVGTDKDQAAIMFNEVTSHLSRCTYFSPYIANNTQSYIQFRTPSDIDHFGDSRRQDNGKFISFNGKATIRVTFKSCIAKGLRGAGNICVILDEMAHYVNKGNSSAEAIYNAVAPSAAAFSPKAPDDTSKPIGDVESRIICISSPLNRVGKFYDLFELAMRGGEAAQNMLAIQAPTWEVNPTVPSSFLIAKYHEDPSTFMTEYGASFSDRVRGWIERKEDLEACINYNARPVTVGMPRYPYYMGIDIGLINDGCAVAITHQEDGKIYLDYHEVWYAKTPWKESNPHLHNHTPIAYARDLQNQTRLDFDAISDWIQSLCDRFYIASGIFDRWNGIPLEQSLKKNGFTQFLSEHFTREISSRIYQNAKLLMLSHNLVLYDYPFNQEETLEQQSNFERNQKSSHSPLIQELMFLQADHKGRNIIVVQAPSQPGFHDDVSDALMRSIWLSSQSVNSNHVISGGSSGNASGGVSVEAAARLQQRRKQRHIQATTSNPAKMRVRSGRR